MPPDSSVPQQITHPHFSASAKDAVLAFVRALARRQARIDAGLLLDHANDNVPATVH